MRERSLGERAHLRQRWRRLVKKLAHQIIPSSSGFTEEEEEEEEEE